MVWCSAQYDTEVMWYAMVWCITWCMIWYAMLSIYCITTHYSTSMECTLHVLYIYYIPTTISSCLSIYARACKAEWMDGWMDGWMVWHDVVWYDTLCYPSTASLLLHYHHYYIPTTTTTYYLLHPYYVMVWWCGVLYRWYDGMVWYDMMWYDMIRYAIHLLHHYTLQYLHGVYSACAILYYIPTTILLLLHPTTLPITLLCWWYATDGWMEWVSGWMGWRNEGSESMHTLPTYLLQYYYHLLHYYLLHAMLLCSNVWMDVLMEWIGYIAPHMDGCTEEQMRWCGYWVSYAISY